MTSSKVSLALVFLFCSSSAFALRNPAFPKALKDRVALGADQERIWAAETTEEHRRPVWVHGGDSIATAWANGPSLRDRLEEAERAPLPKPGSVRDIVSSLPDSKYTWYSGSQIEGGLLGALERWFQSPWVLISVALSGAQATPRLNEDHLELLSSITQGERVRLVTFSLGSNDLCEGKNPVTDDPRFAEKLDKIAKHYPRALVVPFKVVRVFQIWTTVNKRLDELPASKAVQRVREYCRAQWQRFCHKALEPNAIALNAQADQISSIYKTKFTSVYESESVFKDRDPLDVISEDCFHPSRVSNSQLRDGLLAYIQERITP